MQKLIRSGVVLTSISIIMLTIGGCGRPDHMLVREGVNPENADKDVAFRTTYYFRVFDYCAQKNRVDHYMDGKSRKPAVQGKRLYTVMNDAMYRFTMTGKAGTLFNKIHFESGTLKAFELDPLGTPLVYDDESGRYNWGKPSEPDSENPSDSVDARFVNPSLGAAFYALERLNVVDPGKQEVELRKKIQKVIEEQMTPTKYVEANNFEKLNNAIALVETNKNLAKEDKDSLKGSIREVYQGELRALTETPNIVCDNGVPVRKGFQILGPEGWRTFDQEERLVMAMSSSAKPLTKTLKELAQRVKSAKESETGLSLVLLKEHYRLLHAQQVLANGYDLKQADTRCEQSFGADHEGVTEKFDCSAIALKVKAIQAKLAEETPQ